MHGRPRDTRDTPSLCELRVGTRPAATHQIEIGSVQRSQAKVTFAVEGESPDCKPNSRVRLKTDDTLDYLVFTGWMDMDGWVRGGRSGSGADSLFWTLSRRRG